MRLKETIENNAVIWFFGTLLVGFLSGLTVYKGILEIANLAVVPKSEVKNIQRAEQLMTSNSELKKEVGRLKVQESNKDERCNTAIDNTPKLSNESLTAEYDNLKRKYDSCLKELQTSEVTNSESSRQMYESSSESQSKLKPVSAMANTSYSSSYIAQKTIDNDLDTYWSTRSGKTLNIQVEYFFETPIIITQIHMYSPHKGEGYTQIKRASITFYDKLDKEIARHNVDFYGPYEKWQKKKFEPVKNVSKIKVVPTDLTFDIANYLTINEIAFYGF